MMRYLQIEFLKIKTYRVFWLMIALYSLALIFIFFGIPNLIDYLASRTNSNEIKLLKNLAYNFPDIWQNLSWVASGRFFIKVFLGLIIVIMVCNEYSYNTIRSNVLNGLSRWDFLKGKIMFILAFTLFATLVVFLSGIILGLAYSSTSGISVMSRKLIYLFGYYAEVFSYLSFAMFLAVMIRRTGFSMAVLFVYPLIEFIIQQKVNEPYDAYLPVNAMNQVLFSPNTSLIQYSSPDSEIKLQTAIATGDVMLCLGYGVLFIIFTFLLLKYRDL